ncbi:MAG: TraX family protein, partial [Oscillospiraceae bacterium]
FTLKIIAVILMTFDHLYSFFPNIFPYWFTCIGRLSAPLFFFCLAWGLHYTHNKLNYLKRLYIGSLIMGIGDTMLPIIFHAPQGHLMNNIFSTMLCTAIIVFLIDLYRSNDPHFKKYCFGFIVLQAVQLFICIVTVNFAPKFINLAIGVFPSIFGVEGDIMCISMGILLYLFKDDRIKLIISFTLLSLFWIALNPIQWLIIFPLPLMLLYNNKRGYGMKYFFYIYYPLHIFIFYILSVI